MLFDGTCTHASESVDVATNVNFTIAPVTLALR